MVRDGDGLRYDAPEDAECQDVLAAWMLFSWSVQRDACPCNAMWPQELKRVRNAVLGFSAVLLVVVLSPIVQKCSCSFTASIFWYLLVSAVL